MKGTKTLIGVLAAATIGIEAVFAWKNYDSRAKPIGQVMVDYVKEMFE